MEVIPERLNEARAERH